MDRELLLKGQLPERYVAGQLTAEEAAEFEAHMLEHPDLVDHVEAARQLRLGLRNLSELGKLPGLTKTSRGTPVWLMAACLAVAALGIMFFTLRTGESGQLVASLDQLPTSLRAKPAAGSYALAKTRGEPVDVLLPEAPGPITFRLLPAKSTGAIEYSVTLICASATLSTAKSLKVDADGSLTVFLDPTNLHPANCEFKAEGGAEPESFPIRLIKR